MMCKIWIFKLLIKKDCSHIWHNWIRKQISSLSFHSCKLESSTLSKFGYLMPDQEGADLPRHKIFQEAAVLEAKKVRRKLFNYTCVRAQLDNNFFPLNQGTLPQSLQGLPCYLFCSNTPSWSINGAGCVSSTLFGLKSAQNEIFG